MSSTLVFDDIKCFLDLDGVLVDFVSGACKIHGIPIDYTQSENRGKWDIEQLMGISSSDFWKPLEFDFWANLEWMSDGKEILKSVERTFGRDNIAILTSPSKNIGCASGKVVWLEKNMPEYARQYIISPVKHFCAGPKTVLIDDSDQNIKDFEWAGGKGILVPRPWNSLHTVRSFAYDAMAYQIQGLRK